MRPPKKVPPEALFRELCQFPRASRDLDYKIRGIEGFELRVRSLSSLEFFRARDLAKSDKDVAPCLLSACLLADGELAFPDYREIYALCNEEVDSLFAAASDILVEISPIFAVVDVPAWTAALVDGAKHGTNIYTAHVMSECVHISGGVERTVRIPRPDLYYGLPTRELTDGQLLSFYAARKAIDDIEKSKEK